MSAASVAQPRDMSNSQVIFMAGFLAGSVITAILLLAWYFIFGPPPGEELPTAEAEPPIDAKKAA